MAGTPTDLEIGRFVRSRTSGSDGSSQEPSLEASTAEMLIAERSGLVYSVRVPESSSVRRGDGPAAAVTVLDLTDVVSDVGYAEGLLGVALAPDGDWLYADYAGLDGRLHVDRFRRTSGGFARPGEPVIDMAHPYVHKGGDLAFDDAGNLFVSVGAGTVAGTPRAEAQQPDGLVVRLTPADLSDGDNDVRWDQIVADGFRNPWKIALDPTSHDVWVFDVGELAVEEINRVPAPARLADPVTGSVATVLTGTIAPPGAVSVGDDSTPNYGWPYWEGDDRYLTTASDEVPVSVRDAVYSYGHDADHCAVVGGAGLSGDTGGTGPKGETGPWSSIVFGDFCSTIVRRFDVVSNEVTQEPFAVLPAPPTVIVGDNGSVWTATADGSVYALVAKTGDSGGGSRAADNPKPPSTVAEAATSSVTDNATAPLPELCRLAKALTNLSDIESLQASELHTRVDAVRLALNDVVGAGQMPTDPRADYSTLVPLYDRVFAIGSHTNWNVNSREMVELIALVGAERGRYAAAFRAITDVMSRGAQCQ